jgi:hypothetical protein
VNLSELSIKLFAAWLKSTKDRELSAAQETGGGEGIWQSADETDSYAISVRPLFDPGEGQWVQGKAEIEEQLSSALENGSYALWLPPGAELPIDEPGRSDFIYRVKRQAAGLKAGERVDLKMPVEIGLRKQDEEGSYVSALGGMQPVWAWFTNIVKGVYTLDARSLTRLPEDQAARQEIVNAVAAAAEPMRAGENLALEAQDSWTLQRIGGSDGFFIVGSPPAESAADLELRKRLRRYLKEESERLSGTPGSRKVLILPAIFAYTSEENVSTAVRGFDPSLYSGLDYLGVVTDGLFKPVVARS